MSDATIHPDASKLEGMTHESQYNFRLSEDYAYRSEKGLSKRVVEEISYMKNEPEWMLKFRLKALEIAEKKAAQVGTHLCTFT